MNVEKNKSSIPTLLVDFLAKRARQSLLLEMTFPCAHIQRRSRNVHGPFFSPVDYYSFFFFFSESLF
jgi:hypothetical protein